MCLCDHPPPRPPACFSALSSVISFSWLLLCSYSKWPDKETNRWVYSTFVICVSIELKKQNQCNYQYLAPKSITHFWIIHGLLCIKNVSCCCNQTKSLVLHCRVFIIHGCQRGNLRLFRAGRFLQQTYRMRNIKDSCSYYANINMNEVATVTEVNLQEVSLLSRPYYHMHGEWKWLGQELFIYSIVQHSKSTMK